MADPFPSLDITTTPEESLAHCLAEPPEPCGACLPTRGPRSPKPPVQRQLWVRGCGLVWWLSRICCTSCSTEKPELLFPLLQVHLMPWTGGRGRGSEAVPGRGRAGRGGAGPRPTPSKAPLCWEAGSGDKLMCVRREEGARLPHQASLPWELCSSSAPFPGMRLETCSQFPKSKCTRVALQWPLEWRRKGARTGKDR